MGREEVNSRGTTHIHCACVRKTMHFVPTNISLSYNVQMTVQTICLATIYCVPTFTCTAQEGTSTGFWRIRLSALLSHLSDDFHQSTFLCHCLSIGVACYALLSAKMAACQGLVCRAIGLHVSRLHQGLGEL